MILSHVKTDKVSFVKAGHEGHILSVRRISMEGAMAYTTLYRVTNYQPLSIAARLGAVLRLWRRRARERNQLARLSERDLSDIGLSRGTVYAELQKPFWRA
jgi:uncharacterized protein YjiS (DUF1127 family)